MIPDQLVMIAHKHRQLDADDIDIAQMLEDEIERLDEEHGDPAGDYTTWDWDETPGVGAAALKFAEEIAKAYDPHVCDEVDRFRVDVLPWVKANRPDWLTPEGTAAGDGFQLVEKEKT